jgi:hypothetical protein
MVKTFGTQEVFVFESFSNRDKTVEITAVRFQAVHQLQLWDTAATI